MLATNARSSLTAQTGQTPGRAGANQILSHKADEVAAVARIDAARLEVRVHRPQAALVAEQAARVWVELEGGVVAVLEPV